MSSNLIARSNDFLFGPDFSPYAARDMAKRAKAKIDQQLQTLAHKSALQTTPRIVYRRQFEAIIDAANDARADLLVLGRRRKGKFRDLFRGSPGERMMRYGQRPVLVVRDAPDRPYKRILIGTDFSTASERAAAFAIHTFKAVTLEICHAFDIAFSGLLAGAPMAAAPWRAPSSAASPQASCAIRHATF